MNDPRLPALQARVRVAAISLYATLLAQLAVVAALATETIDAPAAILTTIPILVAGWSSSRQYDTAKADVAALLAVEAVDPAAVARYSAALRSFGRAMRSSMETDSPVRWRDPREDPRG